MNRLLSSLAVIASLCGPLQALADDPSSIPSRHRLMKDCMAKQEASDSGLPKEEMKKACRDVTKNEEENARSEKAIDREPAAPAPAMPRS